MKQLIKHLVTASLVFALVATPAVVFAEEGDDSDISTTNTDSSTTSERRAEALRKLQARLDAKKAERQEDRQEAKANLKERLEGAKKRVCEKHEEKINKIMDKMGERRQNAFNRVSQIYDAITKFYTEKNLTVTNYDELVAAVEVAQTAAETAMKEQIDVPGLNCDSEQPRADISEFREKRRASIEAMKAFRDAVRDLAKSVRTVAQSTEGALNENE